MRRVTQDAIDLYGPLGRNLATAFSAARLGVKMASAERNYPPGKDLATVDPVRRGDQPGARGGHRAQREQQITEQSFYVWRKRLRQPERLHCACMSIISTPVWPSSPV